jgi:hypothetical protein
MRADQCRPDQAQRRSGNASLFAKSLMPEHRRFAPRSGLLTSLRFCHQHTETNSRSFDSDRIVDRLYFDLSRSKIVKIDKWSQHVKHVGCHKM